MRTSAAVKQRLLNKNRAGIGQKIDRMLKRSHLHIRSRFAREVKRRRTVAALRYCCALGYTACTARDVYISRGPLLVPVFSAGKTSLVATSSYSLPARDVYISRGPLLVPVFTAGKTSLVATSSYRLPHYQHYAGIVGGDSLVWVLPSGKVLHYVLRDRVRAS